VGFPGWSGGYVGVDVFFVISGFLITSMLVAEAEQYRRIDLWGFYARRVRRLLPAFLTVILGTLLLGAIYLVSLDGEQQGLAKSALAAVLLNANHYFWQATGGYFDRPADLYPLLHIWSLSVEEQYYLIWPLVLIGLLFWQPRLNYRRKVLAVLSFVALVSFLFSVWCLTRTQSAAFYLMPARAWELAMGAVIALAPIRARTSGSTIVGIVLGCGGLAAIALAVTTYDQTTPFPGGAALLPVVGAVAVIAGNYLAPNGAPARVLASKVMVGIGLVSYSWYLWHWPLLAIARTVQLGARDLTRDFLVGGVAAFVLACATYRWIEKPIRWNARMKSLGARASVSFGALASVICVLLAVSLGAWAKYGSKSSFEIKMAAAQRDRPPLLDVCHNMLDQEARLARLDQCQAPAGSQHMDAVLWGDSYAAFWMPALTAIAAMDRMTTYQLTRDACPPLLEFKTTHPDPTQPGKCLEFQRMAFEEIRRLHEKHGLHGVILAAGWGIYAGDEMATALGATLDALTGLGLRVLIIGPSPSLPYKAPECLLRHDEIFCAVNKVDFYHQRMRASNAIEHAATGRKDVRVLDPTAYFCDDKICPAIRDDVVMYVDSGHISATASRHFADYARTDFGWLR